MSLVNQAAGHPDKSGRQREKQKRLRQRGKTPKNLMRQTGSPDAGTIITPGQLKQMLQNYQEGRLNTGQQSFH